MEAKEEVTAKIEICEIRKEMERGRKRKRRRGKMAEVKICEEGKM